MMSKVKTKVLKKFGIKSKQKRKITRKYIFLFVKGNKKFAINNYACNLGLLPNFWGYGELIENNTL